MAREPLFKRIWMTFKFIFEYFYCLIRYDWPRMLTLKQKCVQGQVIVITGGAQGIGKGVALQFALRHQAKVCILDINEVQKESNRYPRKNIFKHEGATTRAAISKSGGICHYFKCDVTSPESVRNCARQIHAHPELVGEFLGMSDADFKINNDVNILGYIYTIRAFLPQMMERNKGQIVAIGSICSFFGGHYGTAYCTAKFAIRGLIEALQMELIEKKKTGICTTIIYPYFTETSLITENLADEPFSTHIDVVPYEECVSEVVDAVLKERFYYFIPWNLTILCTFFKGFTTKSVLPYGKRFFNFRYKPKNCLPVST